MAVDYDLVEYVFNEKMYPELKEYLETNSTYDPLVVKFKPSTSKVFPIVAVKLLPSTNTYGNLSYTQERFSFGIEIDINTQDKSIETSVEENVGTQPTYSSIPRQTIASEIADWAIKYFKDNYRVSTYIDNNAVSTDINVHRTLIRISGVIDTRYGETLEKLVVYPV